jgi:uncharacterized membrane protein
MTVKPENTPKGRFDDSRMDAMMGRLLQAGVMLASAVVLVGGLLYVRAHAGVPVNYDTFVGEPSNLRNPLELPGLLAKGDSAAIIQLGVLLLIATPIARVIFAAISFAIGRDRLYTAISLVVLAVLMFGLMHSS